MWVIRFLNGPSAGQTFQLGPGKNTLGRAPHCDIILNEAGISKEHLMLEVADDKLIITDLNSSNGTYINGIKIRNRRLKPKDKISVHDILFDVQKLSNENALTAAQKPMVSYSAPLHSPTAPPPADDFAVANQGYTPEPENPAEENLVKPASNLKEMVSQYVENVVLPGIYKLPELTEFRWVLGGFVLAFVFIVTALSVLPMVEITKSSIEKESRRRALDIARTLAKTNERALLQNIESSVTVQEAQLKEGVETALVISHVDGHIIAPANKSGEYANHPFFHTARRENKETVKQLDDSTIGASVPVAFYNASIGSYQVAAHAVILYNMGSLAIDEGRTLSLFIQTLAMALIVGLILFFFIFKLIEHPIRDLNEQVDKALKEGNDHVETKYQFQALQDFCDNINSALTRSIHGHGNGGEGFSTAAADKEAEAENLLRIIGCPGLAVSKDSMVIATNDEFENFIGVSLNDLKMRGLEAIPDQAFQLNLSDLMERVQEQPDLIASNVLEINGMNCEINAQSMSGSKGETAYLIVTLQPADGYGEEVA